MSCDGTAIGWPDAGDRMLFEESIKTVASICASGESGTCTAIWSPSKSALNAVQVSGCSLMALQFGADHDDRTAIIIHAFAEQVLPETALFALERVGQRFERAIVHPAQHAATTAVVKERVHRFLQHALLVAHDDFGRLEFDQ